MMVLLVGVFTVSATQAASMDVLYVPEPRSDLDQSHGYHTRLLKMALTAASGGRSVPRIESRGSMVESRAEKELAQGTLIDVFWMGTDRYKEQQLRAIRIPTTRGLIGFRKFIIRQDSVSHFEQIDSLKDLSQKVACQGNDWPDTTILVRAGLPVTTTPIYESLFKMVQLGRCDYFPRGYHDHQQELALRSDQYPELTNYEGIMLHYPFAVYFFTAKDDPQLANWIESGLEALIDNGQLLALMKRHPLTRAAFPLNANPPQHLFSIDNPTLPTDTAYQDSRYWFQPEAFRL
ncbi:hypothetical protein HMF8227_01764 [Saliniradius amylolyticus]|uniref:Solute-binding protein family 3/N-terminal domain-containing protein n=1 Tax=Saliniradius amylolyticus TaxID=2183582 RepID=A0A2S2E5I9_9ALTE|nr:hypothetical protein [Saliniradius amylolyticus]AWL12237.1 hypothetical protein HMF8227_01764 [Saliniradius amylolyticus]